MERSAEQRLKDTIAAGSLLLESSTPQSTKELESVLRNRLLAYYECMNISQCPSLQNLATLEDVQIQTAKEACRVVQTIQDVVHSNEAPNSGTSATESTTSNDIPLLGTRDLSKIRTLLSLVVRWGLEILIRRVARAWNTPSRSSTSYPRAEIIDLTSHSQDYNNYLSLTESMFALVFPQGVEGPIAQSHITSTVIQRHSADILKPAVVLGWLPESMSTTSAPSQRHLRPLLGRFLNLQSSTQAITSLAHILADAKSLPPYVQKVCGVLLTTQLLRNDGLLGLFESVFTEGDLATEETKPEKLEHVARILLSVPGNKDPKEYFTAIIPRLVQLLSEKARPTYRRAAAFALSRSIIAPRPSASQKVASEVTLAHFHQPFQEMFDETQIFDAPQGSIRARSTLDALASLVANSEPLPEFISSLLSPIIADLYMLSFDLDQIKTTDPQLKDVIRSILISWGKIVDQKEGCAILWSIVDSDEKKGEWRCNLGGSIMEVYKPVRLSCIDSLRKLTERSRKPKQGLSLLTPEDVKKMEADEAAADMDMNIFDLYPDPQHFVRFLKELEREDIASDLFVLLLEDYRSMKSRSESEPLKVLKQLQFIIQMQNQLGEGTKSNILRKPDQLLSFVAHVLHSTRVINTEKNAVEDLVGDGSSVKDADDMDSMEDEDSDDEAPDSEVIGPDDELLETTLTLLLSVLEAHESLPARTYPTLNEIFTTLEKIALRGTSTLMPLAREARLVITARLANEKIRPPGSDRDEEETNILETYQKSLKLLQDPILPVRAHGLLLLRQLVSTGFPKATKGTSAATLIQSLGPSILSIFLQSVQDNDSYIFLNAVQGLSGMVDSFGKEILRTLMQQYTDHLTGLGAGNLTQQDVDNRTRIGEALSNVIKRCGSALGIYVDFLVPPLFATVRSRDVPVAIRQSSISLLGDCVDTYPLALLPYLDDMTQGLLDLLKLESVVAPPPELNKPAKQPPMDKTPNEKEKSKGKKKKTFVESDDELDAEKSKDHADVPAKPSLDSDPTSKDSKLPPLRRSALHFFTLLIRSAIKEIYEGRSNFTIPEQLPHRAKNILNYLNATDDDPVVRLMAGEAVETLDQLQEALLGM